MIDSNTVDAVASGSNLTNAEFATRVEAAYTTGNGGVINGSVLGAFHSFGANHTKVLTFLPGDGTNWGVGAGPYHVSGTSAFASSSSGGYNFTSLNFVEIDGGALDEAVVAMGVTVLSVTGRDYGNVTVTARLASGNTLSATESVFAATGAGDTFFGFEAPPGDSITGFSLRYDGAVTGTPDTRLWFDDIGFITAVPAGPMVIDNGNVGFSTVGFWTTNSNEIARDGDVHFSRLGRGNDVAKWTFTGLAAGNYRVSSTWVGHPNRATNSPFTASDGGGQILGTTVINQELDPDDFTDDGSDWENLFVVAVTDGTLMVELSDAADGYVIADAMRIEPTTDPVTPFAMIIDDGAPGFTTSGDWNIALRAIGYQNDLRHHAKGDGSNRATWTFTGLIPGNYEVSATWFAHPNRATDAPFFIFDGTGGPLGAAPRINQELAPDDFSDLGIDWERLAVVTITGTELVVELADDSDQYVIADAIRIIPTTAPSDPYPKIIDNGDPEFSNTIGWNPGTDTNGFDHDVFHASPGDGSSIATWTFENLMPGTYRVSATWTSHSNRATDAPYTIIDGLTPLITLDINQEIPPDDFTDFGADWEDLATVAITGNSLVVQLTDNANEFVIADAIRIEPVIASAVHS